MTLTTIEVPVELRDRIDRVARERGIPAANLIEALLDAYERRRRTAVVGAAVRSADQGYWDEFGTWDLAPAD